MEVQEQDVSCPYCGEMQSLLVDPGNIGFSYVEDCQICCQPMLVLAQEAGDGMVDLSVTREDD